MNLILLLVTFLGAVTSCLASGSDPSACSTLLPFHSEGDLQHSDAPYTVNAETIGANKIRVTISSPTGEEIKGFMLQPRSNSDRNKFIPGEFKTNEMTKAIDCFNRKNSTLTHVDTSLKSQVTTEWMATAPVNEDIIFRATVAKSYAVYWKDIDSNPVELRSSGGGQSQSGQGNSQVLPIYDNCFKTKGCFGMPEECVDRRDCEILFTYQTSPYTEILFVMYGILEKSEYMAMALSSDDKMGEDYVTECFIDRSGNGVLRNSWNQGRSNTRTTETNGHFDVTFRDGLTTCFWVKQNVFYTNGRVYNLVNKKYHILLAKGPVQNDVLRYHISRLSSGEAVNFTSVAPIASGGMKDPVKIPTDRYHSSRLPSGDTFDFPTGEGSVKGEMSDSDKIHAKLDCLLRTVADLKAEVLINKELLLDLRMAEKIEESDIVLENVKTIENLEELTVFEKKLKSEENFAEAVKQYGHFGGKDRKEAVRRILQKLFSHEVASLLSWNASSTKVSIQKFPNTLLFINATVRSNKEFNDISLDDVDDLIKQWLQQIEMEENCRG